MMRCGCGSIRSMAGGFSSTLPRGQRRCSCGPMCPQWTRWWRQDVPGVYRTQVNDVLLSALGRVLRRWTGRDRVLVDLEGHGREEIFEGVDLTRTVGWFTTMFPVVLDVPEDADWGGLLKAV